MKLIYFSMHGSGAQEITLLCAGAGIDIAFPVKDESGPVRTLTRPEEHDALKQLGAESIWTAEEVQDRVLSGEFDAAILSSPDQIKAYAKWAPGIPFIVRHGLNSFKKFLKLNTKNFLTPSRNAALQMPGCNCFVSRKLIPWKFFPRGGWAEDRSGFASYIHHYQKKFPGEHARFSEIAERLGKHGIVLRNFGEESPDGVAEDLSMMCKSMATVHIKGGNVCCNAVTRSMAVGTPVVMDHWTHVRCFFDRVSGIIVTDDIEGEVRQLAEEEEYLEQKIEEVSELSKQFTYDGDLGERFRKFLEDLRA